MEDLPLWAQEQVRRQMTQAHSGAIQSGQPHTSDGQARPKQAKYHNKKAERVMPSGVVIPFDSRKEARRYDELMLLLRAGQIRRLKLQRQYTLQESYITESGMRVRAIRYVADFSYERATEPDVNGVVYWVPVVEDVKSRATQTKTYAIKKKLMRERLNLEITEIE